MRLRARVGRQSFGGAAMSAILALGLATCAIAAAPADGETQTLGLEGWRVQSGALAPQGGAQISTPGFDASSWIAVTPDDAGAPGTEIAALLQSGECPSVFYSEELRRCFGYMSRIGRVTVPRFAVPWWWRTDFTAALAAGQRAELVINGVVGAASVWLNGHAVARRRTVQGAYARYAFDVTSLLRAGVNSLALELRPNDPLRMLTLDDVNWNQIPPDNNTGIEFPIQLHVAGPLALSDVHVLQQDTPTAERRDSDAEGTTREHHLRTGHGRGRGRAHPALRRSDHRSNAPSPWDRKNRRLSPSPPRNSRSCSWSIPPSGGPTRWEHSPCIT